MDAWGLWGTRYQFEDYSIQLGEGEPWFIVDEDVYIELDRPLIMYFDYLCPWDGNFWAEEGYWDPDDPFLRPAKVPAAIGAGATWGIAIVGLREWLLAVLNPPQPDYDTIPEQPPMEPGENESPPRCPEDEDRDWRKDPWKPGEDLYSPTIKGDDPSDRTVGRRFWKNQAESPSRGDYTDGHFDRMRKGNPPRRPMVDQPAKDESMERHHGPIPKRDGGTEMVPLWPDEHERIDPYRRLRKTD